MSLPIKPPACWVRHSPFTIKAAPLLPDHYQFVSDVPVIPVMVIDRLDDAVPLAQALVDGGLTTLEITLRTPCALAAIEQITAQVSGALVGAGTVCNSTQFKAAVDCGAQFVVSPGHSDDLFQASNEHQMPLLPGAVTATEVMAVLNAGFPVIKYFPANTSGGVAAIKALCGPFSSATFVPTGGIGLTNLIDYLAVPNVIAVGGSWVTPANAIKARQWQRITQLASEALQLATSLRSPEGN